MRIIIYIFTVVIIHIEICSMDSKYRPMSKFADTGRIQYSDNVFLNGRIRLIKPSSQYVPLSQRAKNIPQAPETVTKSPVDTYPQQKK